MSALMAIIHDTWRQSKHQWVMILLIAVVAEFAERKQRAERVEYERVLIGEISPAPIVDSKRRGLHTRRDY